MAAMGLPPIAPDTKDWTWVLDRACAECGFDAAALEREQIADMVRIDAERWALVLARPDAARRPHRDAWSPLEYACHVRDVHRIFAERLAAMLTDDDPQFDNWDQDASAVEDDYAAQDPALVSAELLEAAHAVAATYAAVQGDQWLRPGRRSNGSAFTVESLGRYHLHDDVHHLWDVRG
jgi:hypothetical protein